MAVTIMKEIQATVCIAMSDLSDLVALCEWKGGYVVLEDFGGITQAKGHYVEGPQPLAEGEGCLLLIPLVHHLAVTGFED